MVDELISIIVPVYNAEKYIVETMESVLAQTWSGWELLLVEDASTDRSAECIENYISQRGDGRIRLLRQPDPSAGEPGGRPGPEPGAEGGRRAVYRLSGCG